MDNEELTLFRDMTRRALEQEIAPHIEEWEAEHAVPRALWNTLGEAGLLCPDMPEEFGAAGTTPQVTFAVIEELSRMGFGGIASGYGIHSNIVAPYIEHFGTEEQKAQWLPKMVTGEVLGALAMTEPGAGSDVQSIRTSAVRDGDGWILNGSKIFITNGMLADVVIVAAITDPGKGAKGTSLIVVETDGARRRTLDVRRREFRREFDDHASAFHVHVQRVGRVQRPPCVRGCGIDDFLRASVFGRFRLGGERGNRNERKGAGNHDGTKAHGKTQQEVARIVACAMRTTGRFNRGFGASSAGHFVCVVRLAHTLLRGRDRGGVQAIWNGSKGTVTHRAL